MHTSRSALIDSSSSRAALRPHASERAAVRPLRSTHVRRKGSGHFNGLIALIAFVKKSRRTAALTPSVSDSSKCLAKNFLRKFLV
jgi:hypothetical protein